MMTTGPETCRYAGFVNQSRHDTCSYGNERDAKAKPSQVGTGERNVGLKGRSMPSAVCGGGRGKLSDSFPAPLRDRQQSQH